MDIKFTIYRENILGNVKLHTYYKGEALKEGQTERIATVLQASDDNDDILSMFIDEAAARVSDFLTDLPLVDVNFEKSTSSELGESSDKTEYVWTCNIEKTFDEQQKIGIIIGIEEFMTDYTLAKWYSIAKPDEAKIYYTLAEEKRLTLNHRLNQRTKPIRRPTQSIGF